MVLRRYEQFPPPVREYEDVPGRSIVTIAFGAMIVAVASVGGANESPGVRKCIFSEMMTDVRGAGEIAFTVLSGLAFSKSSFFPCSVCSHGSAGHAGCRACCKNAAPAPNEPRGARRPIVSLVPEIPAAHLASAETAPRGRFQLHSAPKKSASVPQERNKFRARKMALAGRSASRRMK